MPDINSNNYLVQHLYTRLIGSENSVEDVKLAVFIISPKDSGIKVLNLSGLSSNERMAVLQNLSELDSFAAVVQKADGAYAHVSPAIADHMKKQGEAVWPLSSIDGKPVKVQVLNAVDYAELSQVGRDANALEEFLEASNNQPGIEKQEVSKTQVYTPKRSSSNLALLLREKVDRLLLGLEGKNEEIKTQLLIKWLENIEQIEEETKAAYKEIDKKHHEIKDQEVKRNTRRFEIQNGQ